MKCFIPIIARTSAIPILVALCLTLPSVSWSEAAASGLTLAEACAADGTASLYFGWQGVNPAAKELWLDVTSLGDGHRPAATVSAGPLSPAARSYDNWRGFRAGGTYYIRLNQLMWDGIWDPSGTVSFTTFRCDLAGAYPSAGTTGSTDLTSSQGSVSATGYASGPGSVSATGYADGPGSLSATGYTAEFGSTIAATRPVPPPTNTLTYYMGAGASPQGGGNSGDYDCADGTGDGPNYVQGPVPIGGPDVYGLDADGDGIGGE